ncbi:hypothetical protein CF133_06520 [Aeromonas salmonicida]|nr:hypothetical protein CF133_06520 [Aeromonas salmonicida]
MAALQAVRLRGLFLQYHFLSLVLARWCDRVNHPGLLGLLSPYQSNAAFDDSILQNDLDMTASGRAVMLRIESAKRCCLAPSGFHRSCLRLCEAARSACRTRGQLHRSALPL